MSAATFILVHGAWHDARSWASVPARLEGLGHRVIAVDLPGRGSPDSASVSLTDTAAVVEDLIAAHPGAIVVGHSLGGVSIAQAAESAADEIGALVYLAAFAPQDGQCAMDIALSAPFAESLVLRHLEVDEHSGMCTVAADHAAEAFYGTADSVIAEAAVAGLLPEGLLLMNSPVHVSEARFGAVPKHYIETLFDRAVPIECQRSMQVALGGVEVHTLATDHSPFLSAPDHLVETLDTIAHHTSSEPSPRASLVTKAMK